jgi:hypothetical protein
MGVEFNEESQTRGIPSFVPTTGKQPAMVSFLINKGIAKDEKSANRFLLILALIFFGLAIFFTFF